MGSTSDHLAMRLYARYGAGCIGRRIRRSVGVVAMLAVLTAVGACSGRQQQTVKVEAEAGSQRRASFYRVSVDSCNALLPARLDSFTILTAVGYIETSNTFVYHYVLSNRSTPFDASELNSRKQRAIFTLSRLDDATMRQMRHYGTTLRYQYSSETGASLGYFDISPQEY